MNEPNTQIISTSAVEAEAALFELAQRKAAIYSKSTLVPKQYQGNIGNVMIAENMAMRLGADVLMTMQNLYIVHGSPGWSAKFLIACFNKCGRFTAIKYRFTGEKGKPTWGCIAYATELATGEIVEGCEVTLAMAKAEGWSTKNGSKWLTMPQQMLMYRSATFFIRTTAPEIGMGLQTREELEDQIIDVRVSDSPAAITSLDDLTASLEDKSEPEEALEADSSEPMKVESTDEAFPELKVVAAALEAIENATDAATVTDQLGIVEQGLEPLKLPAKRKKELLSQVLKASKAKHEELSE